MLKCKNKAIGQAYIIMLTVPLKSNESPGLHWIMAPLKCVLLTGNMQLQASSSTNTGMVLMGASIPASYYIHICRATLHNTAARAVTCEKLGFYSLLQG